MKYLLLAGLLLASLAAPADAQYYGGYGGWRGGVGFGVIPPPIVVAPPVYVAPPPVYYTPAPAYVQPNYGQSCYADRFVCPVQPSPVGAPCSCPVGGGSRVGGRVG